jgi:ketosteroid isomerase-like protein
VIRKYAQGEAIRLAVVLLLCELVASCARPAQDRGGPVDGLLEELVALERSALDRWIELDPQGYLGLYAPEVTYFDPFTESRVDGLNAMQVRLAPMKDIKPPFTNPRYEMINPRVQRNGDVALLTFNLVNYGRPPDTRERVLARWNANEAYSRIGGTWRIIHSHWSFVQAQPNLSGS